MVTSSYILWVHFQMWEKLNTPASVCVCGVSPCNFQNKKLNLTSIDVNTIIISYGNKVH